MGPALAPTGINIVEFCKNFNARTADQVGTIIPVEVTVYEDRSYYGPEDAACVVPDQEGDWLESGSAVPNRTKVGKLSREKLREIAEIKMPDLNASDIEAAMRMVAGSARSMGVEVED